MTGALSFKHAKAGLIRDLIAARTDPALFALSYDYVGDLSETVALMWPRAGPADQLAAAAVARRGRQHPRQPAEEGTAGAARAMARRTRRDRPLGAAEARHRRAAHRRLGAAGEDRGGSARRARTRTRSSCSGRDLRRPTSSCSPGSRAAREKPVNRDPAPFRPVMLAHAIEDAISRASIRPTSPPNGSGTASACRR